MGPLSYMRSVVGRNVMRRIPDECAPRVRCSTRKWQDDLMLMSRTPFVIVDCHSTTRFCPWGSGLSFAPTNQAAHRRPPAPVIIERLSGLLKNACSPAREMLPAGSQNIMMKYYWRIDLLYDLCLC